jgi:UDP-N-acetylmuramoyl-tripeptide--D-alanyl-D-alanine ligase
VIPLSAAEAGAALGLRPLRSDVCAVSTDSRNLRPGDLFIALRGEVHDGHGFVEAALNAGAAGAVVERGFAAPEEHRERVYQVPDTLAALSALARAVRSKSRARVIGVTGSVGKTSTKDILRTLAAMAGPVLATNANENNEVGVPLTLLRLEAGTAVAVIEMGMRGEGQIASLASIARPHVGVITKVAPVHLELLGSLERIAAAKAEMLGGLEPDGVAVVPLSAPYSLGELEARAARVIRFGFGQGEEAAEVWGRAGPVVGGKRLLEVDWGRGRGAVELTWSSRHRLENAIGAIAAAYAAGLDPLLLLEYLPETVFTPLRGDEFEVDGILVLDDTYNANPAAMRSALDTLRDRAGERGGRAVAVLGDMLELGPGADGFHREVGLYAAECGVEILWALGQYSRAMVEAFWDGARLEPDARYLPRTQESDEECRALGVELAFNLRRGDAVLVKASRGLRLERVVEGLREGLRERGPG